MSTQPTQTDYDLTRDIAHVVGLAITEESGRTGPVLNHAPSTKVYGEKLRTTLFLPKVCPDEFRAIRYALTRNGARVIASERNEVGRWTITVQVRRDLATLWGWERAASRTITPGTSR